MIFFPRLYYLEQGSPTPRPWTGTSPRPVRNRPHSRRWAAGERVKLHLCSPPLALPPGPSPAPGTLVRQKNCLPRNRSLVPKRLGAAGLEAIFSVPSYRHARDKTYMLKDKEIHISSEEKGTLVHCWWECKLVQLLWKTVWRSLKKRKIELPYDPAMPLLSIHLGKTETLIWKDTCTPMFMAALFTIGQDMETTQVPMNRWSV